MLFVGSHVAPSPEVGGTYKRITEKEQRGGTQDAGGSDECDKQIGEANDAVGEEDKDQLTVSGAEDTGNKRNEELQSRAKSTRSRKRLPDKATRGGRAKRVRRGVQMGMKMTFMSNPNEIGNYDSPSKHYGGIWRSLGVSSAIWSSCGGFQA